MNEDTITTLNLISGQVGTNPRAYLDIEPFSEYLIEVHPETKSFEPTKYKQMTKEEYLAWQAEKATKEDADRAAAEKQAAIDAKAAAKATAEATPTAPISTVDADAAKAAESKTAEPVDTTDGNKK